MGTEFTPEQFGQIYPDGIQHHWWHVARSAIVARELSWACPGQAVLDVGCGRGVTLLHLRDRGIECFGVEPAAVTPLPGTEDYIYAGTEAADVVSADRERFKVVMLLDVIEHLAEPVEFLETIAAAYPNLACVVVTVPARQELWTNYDDFNGHFRRYTPEMIGELASRLDWKVMRRRYFFRALYPPMRFLSLVGRRRSTRISPPNGVALGLHKFVARGLAFEQSIPLGRVPGSSIIASFGVGAAGGRAADFPNSSRTGGSA